MMFSMLQLMLQKTDKEMLVVRHHNGASQRNGTPIQIGWDAKLVPNSLITVFDNEPWNLYLTDADHFTMDTDYPEIPRGGRIEISV